MSAHRAPPARPPASAPPVRCPRCGRLVEYYCDRIGRLQWYCPESERRVSAGLGLCVRPVVQYTPGPVETARPARRRRRAAPYVRTGASEAKRLASHRATMRRKYLQKYPPVAA